MIEKPYLENRLRQTAFNSSHYVLLLADLQYFESSQGYLFAYAVTRGILYVALEPLPKTDGLNDADAFGRALAEIEAFAGTHTTVFIGVYENCMAHLAALGFVGLRVGSDPWVTLEIGGPKGNKAKGIRSARNQALRHGVEVEEWRLEDMPAHPAREREVKRVQALWSEASLFKLGGFLLVADPLAPVAGRRLFVARVANRVVGFLVTSPVRFGRSSYFEDLMFLPDAPNGATELLLLHAMEALRLDGQTEVSLGVVALNNLAVFDTSRESAFDRQALALIKRVAKFFYNSEGIELNRKRYQPKRWEHTYIACRRNSTGRGHAKVSVGTWCSVLATIVIMLKPRLKVSPSQAFNLVRRWAAKHAAAIAWALATCVLAKQAGYHRSAFGGALALGLLTCSWVHSHIRGREFFVTAGVGYLLSEIFFLPPVMDAFDRGPVESLPDRLSLMPFWPALFATGCSLFYSGRKRAAWVGSTALLVPLIFSMSAGHPEIFAERLFPIVFLFMGYLAGRTNFAIYRRKSASHSKDKSPVHAPEGVNSAPNPSAVTRSAKV